MKEVSEISVSQIRLYAPDKIPFQQLSAGRNYEKIKDSFRFENIQPDAAKGLVFSNGLLTHGGDAIIVNEIAIDARRIALRVRGISAQADAVQNVFWRWLKSLVPPAIELDDTPLTKSQETVCVACLDIGFDELVAPALMKLLRVQGRTLLSNETVAAKSIELATLSFTVKYDPKDPVLEERGILLVNKAITIQPRAGTPLREKRFFVSSPTDSETHLDLLRAIEKQLIESR